MKGFESPKEEESVDEMLERIHKRESRIVESLGDPELEAVSQKIYGLSMGGVYTTLYGEGSKSPKYADSQERLEKMISERGADVARYSMRKKSEYDKAGMGWINEHHYKYIFLKPEYISEAAEQLDDETVRSLLKDIHSGLMDSFGELSSTLSMYPEYRSASRSENRNFERLVEIYDLMRDNLRALLPRLGEEGRVLNEGLLAEIDLHIEPKE